MKVTRRSFLAGATASAIATQGAWSSTRFAFAGEPAVAGYGTVVVVFLRGGLDGISAIVPWSDASYYDARPTLAVPQGAVLDIDGTFGFHPALAPLFELHEGGGLAVVHAAGLSDAGRSHFEVQSRMEAASHDPTVSRSGWLDRHLATVGAIDGQTLAAVAWGPALPRSMRGTEAAVSLRSLAEFGLASHPNESHRTRQAIEALYRHDDGVLGGSGRAVLPSIDRVASVVATTPVSTVSYPASQLGADLAEVARTIKADVGLAAATIDVDGWDLHADLGSMNGLLADKLVDLGRSLRAFSDDMGAAMASTTVIVMSEFGRRVRENGSRGADHGKGNAILLLGSGLAGGRVHGEWRGMHRSVLDAGDVPVLTDYRDVIGEVLKGRHASDLDRVFPGHVHRPVGLCGGDSCSGAFVAPPPPESAGPRSVSAPGSRYLPAMTVTYENETLTTTWSEVDGGTNYQLRWTADDGRKQWESPSRLRSHVVTPADPDTRYVVDVRAYAAGSWRSWNSVEITPSAVGAPSDPPPSAPPDDDPGSGSGAQQTVSAGGTRFTPAVTVRQEDSTLVTSWEAVADAQNYQFRHRVGSARMEWSAPDQSRTKVLTDVAYGVAHEIEVRAYVAKAWRGWTTVSITPVAPN